MKRFVCAAALTAGFLVLPAAASAAIHQIEINEVSSSYCVALDNGPAGVTFTVRAPGGGVLRSVRTTTATASQNCDGGATPGAESFRTLVDTSPGSTVTADAGSGVTTTFPVPYGAYDAVDGVGTAKLGGLPPAGGIATFNGVDRPYTGTTSTTPPSITIGTGEASVASTIGGIPYSVLLQTIQYSIQASYYGNVGVYGADPLGAPITVSVSGGGGPSRSTSIAPSVDHNQYDETDLSGYLSGGAVVAAAQPGWFSHALTLGSVSASASTLTASIPAVSGVTGTVSFELQFQATNPLPPGSPLACASFGNAAYMLSQCSTVGARYAASFPVFFSAYDSAEVSVQEPDGDRGTTDFRGSGLVAYPRDGEISLGGLVPSAPVTLTGTSPTQATATVSGTAYPDGTVFFGGEGGGTYLPMRLVSGTSVVASGPGSPTPRTFSLNLDAHASGTTVSGTTYPGGRVSVFNDRPVGSETTVFGTADGNGGFSLDVGPLLPRDSVRVYASDPSGSTVVERVLYPGSPQPAIQDLADQQLVHGTVTASALGGGPMGIFWGGDGPGGLSAAAPFSYALDTTLLKDGPHRISASAAGIYNGASDYLYVRVDNTAPVVSAGPSQTAAIARPTVLLPSASDANGMASLSVSFGDGTPAVSQPLASIGQPIRHAYAKGGTFTETVTGTDAAGNTASATATVHVIGSLSEQVAGKVPGTFKQAKKLKKRKNLTVKFTSHMAGVLNVRILNASSKLRATSNLTFAKADARATLTVATKKWGKGRYLVVLQFTDANGLVGPVVLQALRIK